MEMEPVFPSGPPQIAPPAVNPSPSQSPIGGVATSNPSTTNGGPARAATHARCRIDAASLVSPRG
eukprot:scaffold130815_cov29-Tisochrysis_lutea.AAC.2